MKIVMISLDTLRADHLSCLGYHRPLTPNLDRLAREGALFTNMFASDIPTQPAHTSIFTGRFGINTDIVSHFFPPAALDPAMPWLPSMAEDAGRPTGAVDHLFVMKDWFERGYGDYIVPPGRSRSPAQAINELAYPFIRAHAGDDFFLFLHYWDAHIPYVPPTEFRERFVRLSSMRRDPDVLEKVQARPSYPLFKRNLYDYLDDIPSLDYIADLYDAEIAYLDSQIGVLVGYLNDLGILDETLLVLFGDHGENMIEHDAWFDHAGLYDSITHVPVIIRYPPAIPRATVGDVVQLVDLFPTICDLAGFNVPGGTDGRSLLPLMATPASERRSGTIFLSEATWQAKRAIRTPEWKYIRCYAPGTYGRSEPELYHLASDPDEQVNLAAVRPEVAAQLDRKLDEWVERQLGGKPDPMSYVVEQGLPAVERLRKVVEEDMVASLATTPRFVAEPFAGASAGPRASVAG
ncbi:MAG: sulfatase family protein [Acidimicrobiales bacterium]